MDDNIPKKPILFKGEVYSQLVPKGGGGNTKQMRHSFEEAREIVLRDVENIKTSLQNMPSSYRLPNEVILSFILEEGFSAKSYYPDSLFDLDSEKFGLTEVGSRIFRYEEANEENEEVVKTTKMLFVRATKNSLESFQRQLNISNERLTDKFKNDIQKISSIGFLPLDEKALGFPEDWESGRLEAVLHPFDIDSNVTLDHFLGKIKACGVEMDDVRYKQYKSGVTFVSFPGNKDVLGSISEYNPLRTVHPLKMRTLPDINRSTVVKGGPTEPSFSKKSSIVVGVIDGGINPSNPFLKNYSEAEMSVSGNPILDFTNHANQVAGAVLYGALNKYSSNEELPEPSVSIKSFGVISDQTPDDPNLYDIIDAIEDIVPANENIKVYNLSLGPRGPILDDNISRFTYSCDLLSKTYEVLFCVAVGNDGEVTGYNRIQSPADSVNC
ncbi:MAG: S8 family serine peptidase, partial [Flavobacteriales bacterium]|nr:S8 family serine peptidase [Flavobacteriales bacterium]